MALIGKSLPLKGKKILVTGGARRVGEAICRALASRGAEVIVHYHRSEPAARELAASLKKLGGRAETVQFDLADIAGMRETVSALLERHGSLDALVCNAAVFFPTPFFDVREQDWDTIVNTNLKGNFFLCQQIGAKMLADEKGDIVLITDVSGEFPWTGYLPYTVSKAGLNHLVKGLAKALAPHVRVNGIAPGTVLPPDGASLDELEGYRRRTLLGRIGEPEDVAQAVLFFLENARFVTGTVLPVDGGYRLKGV